MKYSYIYEIIDHRGYFYIGKKYGERKNYFASGIHINNAIKEFGKEKFNKRIIYDGFFTKEEIANLEKFYIAFYRKNWNVYYNHSNGGDGGDNFKGRKHSDETKQRISNSLKGRRHTEEAKQNMSKAQKGHSPRGGAKSGHYVSEETKRKISESLKGNTINKGRILSKEHKRKLSESMKKHCRKNGYSIRSHKPNSVSSTLTPAI